MQAQNGTSDPMHGLQVHRWYESADTILALVGLARNKLSGVPPANTLVLHHVEGLQTCIALSPVTPKLRFPF
jgi:hypothetical protein